MPVTHTKGNRTMKSQARSFRIALSLLTDRYGLIRVPAWALVKGTLAGSAVKVTSTNPETYEGI